MMKSTNCGYETFLCLHQKLANYVQLSKILKRYDTTVSSPFDSLHSTSCHTQDVALCWMDPPNSFPLPHNNVMLCYSTITIHIGQISAIQISILVTFFVFLFYFSNSTLSLFLTSILWLTILSKKKSSLASASQTTYQIALQRT